MIAPLILSASGVLIILVRPVTLSVHRRRPDQPAPPAPPPTDLLRNIP